LQGEIVIDRTQFRVRAEPKAGRFRLDLDSFSQEFRANVAVDSLTEFDRTVAVSWVGVQQRGDHERLSWTSTSTLWTKRLHLDVYDAHAEFHTEVLGVGAVDAIRYFDEIPDAGFRPHFAVTKHFNDKGQTDAREYALGSPVTFRSVFCPEPNSYNRQMLRAYEYAQISVNADLDVYGGNFIANPGPLCFAVAADPARGWLGMGLAVTPGEYHFSEYEYLGGEDFALRLNSWGAHAVAGRLLTPRIVLVPAANERDAVRRYVDVLHTQGLVRSPQRSSASWWTRPIVCGWGHQCYQADLFRIRSSPERPADNAAYTLSTQATYREILDHLDEQGLAWGTVVIDARWFLAGGLKNVDTGRWPNLRGFIDAQHRRGRRVLLWWAPWDPEGVPAEQCVRYDPELERGRQNRPGRLSKFGTPVPSKKLGIDITLPQVRDRIRDQVRLLLGSKGLDADGLKIDHVSAVPGIYGMAFPEGSGRLFGIEAVRSYLGFLYETVKQVKPDALLMGQSPNPYLADVQDMLRLGDIYATRAESVVSEMSFRAEVARIVDPSWLIDTDGWPMPSLAALREYIDVQPSLGVPSLYYATHLDTTGEALSIGDYARIRKAWSEAAA
jgi:hypothetical protein